MFADRNRNCLEFFAVLLQEIHSAVVRDLFMRCDALSFLDRAELSDIDRCFDAIVINLHAVCHRTQNILNVGVHTMLFKYIYNFLISRIEQYGKDSTK